MRKKQLFRRKTKLKLCLAYFLSAIVITSFYVLFLFKANANDSNRDFSHERHLTSSNFIPSIFTHNERQNGAVILYIFGMCYMFVGIALACDEFFVPALEVIGDHLGWSDDVQGATLMAAGGSAPELCTSLIGTLALKTDVGFGTIVGSAVFNVLFVIAMCAMWSKEVLSLTGWPLARDCIYYTISLLTLALFFGVISPHQIDWWEALILFLMYIGYVFLMKNNEILYKKYFKKPSEGVEMENPNKKDQSMGDNEGKVDVSQSDTSVVEVDFRRSSKFRAGLLDYMLSTRSLFIESVDSSLQVFDKILEKENGVLEKDKIRKILQTIELKKGIDEFFENWEEPPMSVTEFKNWYSNIVGNIRTDIFNEFPDEKFDQSQLKNNLQNLNIGCCEVSDVATNFFQFLKDHQMMEKDNRRKIFEEWYRREFFYVIASGDEPEFPEWPNNLKEKIFYVLISPLMFPMYFSTRDPKISNFAAIHTFFVSIIFIGIFSTFMVQWSDTFGATIDMPPKVMGLTLIAAGTSIPDLLSSVIVARQGKGDMAVSSSIGSNIFDILVGLPIPWLLGNLIFKHPISVEKGGDGSLLLSILILILMLGSTVGTIAFSGWKLSRKLAIIMLVFYVIFVLQDLLRAYNILSSPIG